MKEITYVSDSPTKEYAVAIRKARNRTELVKTIEAYERVADDALECAKRMTDADFADFKRDIRKAARKMPDKWIKRFNERFGDIAMPAKLMVSELAASQFNVPWGCAFIRCEEEKWPMLKKKTKHTS